MDEVPRHGISLAGIDAFVAECGGDRILAGMSTKEVCKEFMMHATAASRRSYCGDIATTAAQHAAAASGAAASGAAASHGTLLVADATVFVSHAWEFLFLDVY